ncbi:MAG: hypothetical protein R3A10_07330 [Caldilineaceae bacterium]
MRADGVHLLDIDELNTGGRSARVAPGADSRVNAIIDEETAASTRP